MMYQVARCNYRSPSWSISVGMLGDDNWPPAVDFYDFLKIMDEQEPDSAQQQTPDDEEDVEDVNVEEHVGVKETTNSFSTSSTPNNNPKTHTEL